MPIPKTLFLPTNGSGVNWYRMVLFFKNMLKVKADTALYGYLPNDNQIAKWEHEFAVDKMAKGIRNEVYQLMRWCEVAVIGFAHYPETISLIDGFMAKDKKECLATLGPKKIVCDIDDFVIDTPAYNPAYKSGWKPGGPYGWVPTHHIKLADMVINSTEWLCEQHKVFNKNCIVIPNSVDEEWWKVKITEKKSKTLRIGWVGGANHEDDFYVMPRVIEKILERHKNVEFYFVHGAPYYIRSMGMGKKVRFDNAWSCVEKYPQFLADYHFDIGIAPLDYNRFNMGKSSLKFLEYSMLGIAGVYSDWEPYKCVRHGVDGFKATKIQEWTDCLSELIESEDLRVKMGKVARERVIKDFNIKDTTQKYLKALGSLS
jgi:O-antigen biosynthesis protein